MSAALHSGDVVASISIEGLLVKRAGVIKLLRAAIDNLAEARSLTVQGEMLTETYRQFGWVVDGAARHENTLLSEDGFKAILVRLDSALWGKLMHESGLLTFMDSKARADFAEKIDKCQTPPLTPENIEATFRDLYAGREDMFDRGVIACFKSLSWDYKTNNPVKFGKRIIKNYLCERWGGFSSRALSDLDDLQRVLRVMDGKVEEDHRECLSSRLRGTANGGRELGQHVDQYMIVKWFKNGNGHITFTNLALVGRMNSIIAKHYPGALPAVRA